MGLDRDEPWLKPIFKIILNRNSETRCTLFLYFTNYNLLFSSHDAVLLILYSDYNFLLKTAYYHSFISP